MASFTLPFEMGARIALVGMGKTNYGILKTLSGRRDLKISLRDKKEIQTPPALPFDVPVAIRTGEGYLRDLDEEYLFLSPTVKVDEEEIVQARLRGARVSSDVSFFLEHTKSVCFGVTGSDGKSTTVSLANAILSEGGRTSRTGGNIGKVLMPYLFEEEAGDFCVLELSSFQLQMEATQIERGLVTNLTPNHLDFHSSLEEYYNVKIGLLYTANCPIINADDEEILRRTSAFTPYVSYSMQERASRRGEHEYTVIGGVIYQDGKPYFPLYDYASRGGTFLKNVLASLALTHGYHTPESVGRAISSFRPLPHRRQFVRAYRGVVYYNCSADSTPSRTVETLSTFSSPVVLIIGGRSKGVDYDILAPMVEKGVRTVILCGENAEQIRESISTVTVPCMCVASLSEAVNLATEVATEGDAVVFSPASTSFDSYQNFEERGRIFSSLVNQLK